MPVNKKKVSKKSTVKKSKIRSIAVLTSGGDSPGMNCAIRSVVRASIGKGLKAYGIRKGFAGLLEGNIHEMDASSVGNIMQRGGTILQTSRCLEFHQKDIRKEAFNILKRNNIDALVVIGGDGSFNGAYNLYKEHNFPVAGIPGTIDNDIANTDYTIGFDTAVMTAVGAVDKIKDTASSHERTFIVEVMGRRSAAIALHVGVCTGAENIVFPTGKINHSQIAADIKRGMDRGKTCSIIVVAEGSVAGNSYDLQDVLSSIYDIDAHVCILGHIQRGGSPTPLDRFLASKMGHVAVDELFKGKKGIVTSFTKGFVQSIPMIKCLSNKKNYELPYIELVESLSI